MKLATLSLLISILFSPTIHANELSRLIEILERKVADIEDKQKALSKIKADDGIDKSEAEIIANYFFYNHQSISCGAAGQIVDNNDSWKIPTFMGVAGSPYKPVFVSKNSGSITWEDEVVLKDYRKMIGEYPDQYYDKKKMIKKLKDEQ